MNESGKVLLITGPAGSGKSTLAEHVSHELDWLNISEDEYWVNNGWGEGLRTEEQEKIIQEQVLSDLQSICQMGKSAVLEFILYKNPPNPLSRYTESLNDTSIEHYVVALKPSVDEILRRIQEQGRPNDMDRLEEKSINAKNQIQCLDAAHIKPEWIIDSTDISVEELAELVVNRLRNSS